MAARGTGRATAAREVVITRVFDAPRRLVFEAWTRPEQVMRWWGPGVFTSPSARVDLRVGASFLFCMRAPDGRDFWTKGVYCEIVEPERIVYADSLANADGNVVPATHYGLPADFPTETRVTEERRPRASARRPARVTL